jgi:hypothetical protein
MESLEQGCQMVCFQTKNTNLGKHFRASDWKMLIYFMAFWNIYWTLGIFFDHLANFVFIWFIFSSFGSFFSSFGITHQEKSGNPGLEEEKTAPV